MLFFSFMHTINYDQLSFYITIYFVHSVVSDLFGWNAAGLKRASEVVLM